MPPLDRRWLPLNALRAFEAVASRLSFTAGANALHVTQSALSRHVIGLEELLGRRLFERRPHGLVLTEAGAALLPAVTQSFDRIEAVLNGIVRDSGVKPRTLRVHMPPSFLQQLGLPIVQEFRREFPDILVDVSSSYGTGLSARDLDVAVVYDRPQVTDSVRDLLWMVRVTPVCSPAVAARAEGVDLASFLHQAELLHVKLGGQPRAALWEDFARRFGLDLDTGRGVSFDTLVVAVQWAMSGSGVVLADMDMFSREIADGRLAAPFPAVLADGYGYYLTSHPESLGDPAVSLFRSWIIARFGHGRAQPGAG